MTEQQTCPQCGKRVNPRSALCPFCGGRLDNVKVVDQPLCPRCGIHLDPQRREDFEIDSCPQCNGLWLDRGEFAVVTAESTVYREERLASEYSRPPLPGRIEYVPCARCRKLMVRKNFARISGVIIDECGRHGIWLDSGELDKIRQFILDGGLHKQQAHETENIRADLRDLAEKVDDTAFTQKLIHFWDWRRWFFRP